jgi:hypothetical protein
VSVSITVQVPKPAGERWKTTCWTPEPASAESDETPVRPRTTAAAAGAVIEPVGLAVSTVKGRGPAESPLCIAFTV